MFPKSQGRLLSSVYESYWSIELPFKDNERGKILSLKILINDEMFQIGPNVQVLLPENKNGFSETLEVKVYPWFFNEIGRYEYQRNIYSPVLKNYRVIYLPPSYDENTFKANYSTIIMHDGENLFNASTSFGGVAWLCQDTINALINEMAMEEVIIIGIYNTMDRTDEYTYSYDPSEGAGGKGDKYLDFIEKIVLPYVSSKYRITDRKEDLGMIGSSLGGLISCYAGWTRSKVYGKVGCMSSSFWWNSEDFDNRILNENTGKKDVKFYLDSGNRGPGNDDYRETLNVTSHLQTLGFEMNSTLFYYLDDGGRHNEQYWGRRFWVPMVDLFPPKIDFPTFT